MAGAVETEVDRQGRIIVPSYLCVFAKLMKKVIISGLYDRLEIWDEREWEKTKQKAEREKERVAEELGRMGIY